MACQTILTAEGGSCATGLGLGNLASITLDGIWTLGGATACGRSWLSVFQNGVRHPNPDYLFYPPTATVVYTGCGAQYDKCDCVNGGCVPSTTYNTPGKYANLAACESGCGKDSPCDGECVSTAQIAALQQAAANVQTRLCG
jgi:hypothetical protein